MYLPFSQVLQNVPVPSQSPSSLVHHVIFRGAKIAQHILSFALNAGNALRVSQILRFDRPVPPVA